MNDQAAGNSPKRRRVECCKFHVQLTPEITETIDVDDPSTPALDLIDAIAQLVIKHISLDPCVTIPTHTLFGTATKIPGLGTYYLHLSDSPMNVISVNTFSTVRQVHGWSEDGNLAISWLIHCGDNDDDDVIPLEDDKESISDTFKANIGFFDRLPEPRQSDQDLWQSRLMLTRKQHKNYMQQVNIEELFRESNVQVTCQLHPLTATVMSLQGDDELPLVPLPEELNNNSQSGEVYAAWTIIGKRSNLSHFFKLFRQTEDDQEVPQFDKSMDYQNVDALPPLFEDDLNVLLSLSGLNINEVE